MGRVSRSLCREQGAPPGASGDLPLRDSVIPAEVEHLNATHSLLTDESVGTA